MPNVSNSTPAPGCSSSRRSTKDSACRRSKRCRQGAGRRVRIADRCLKWSGRPACSSILQTSRRCQRRSSACILDDAAAAERVRQGWNVRDRSRGMRPRPHCDRPTPRPSRRRNRHRMRVAIDARELRGQPTGVGRYLAGLLDAWETLPAARSHEFVLCAPGPIDRASPVLPRRSSAQGGSGKAGTLVGTTHLAALVRESEADVLFAPGYTARCSARCRLWSPSTTSRLLRILNGSHRREGLRRRDPRDLARGRRAARVLTISEFSKREIAQRLGIDGR